jgi:4-carboxymuconolactone decarboxylase
MMERREDTTATQVEAFDHIAASRGGQMIRPFAAMIHRPEIARVAADLGAVIRFQSTLSDRDREVVICTTAAERDCPFERESHLPIARGRRVSANTLAQIESGATVEDSDDAALVDFNRELCRTGKVGDEAFKRARNVSARRAQWSWPP